MLKIISLLTLLLVTVGLYAQGRCQKGNCQTGAGVLRFADGSLYSGNFSEGRFEGLGTLTYPDGSVYTGNFRRQLQNGKGTLVDANGNRYVGLWRSGKRHGQGQLTYLDGSRIDGNWVAGKLEGEVTFSFANRDYYVGHMSDDMMNGFGKMEYANGDSYVGDWKNNLPHGEGKMLFADGTAIQAKWQAGEPAIEWSTLGFTKDEETLANCNEGCPDGTGRYAYQDGTEYVGQIRDGVPNGEGSVRFVDGRRYAGNFIDHRPEGLGVMYYPSGEITGGVWQAGQLARRLHSSASEPTTAAPVADYDPEVRVWAVVVGCAFYQHMKTLRYTDDDAYQIYAFLKSIEGGALPDEQLKILIDEEATRENILLAMEETYRQADENDLILFYFSGHGLPGSFLPIDYDGQLNELRHEDVQDALLGSRSRHKLVIADACHSGSLAAKSGGGSAEALSAYYTALTNARASTALMMSSRSEEISMEDGGLRSGVFSHYLIRGLKGEADVNHDGLVAIQELFAYVHREVRGYTGNIQTPTLTGTYDELMPIASVRTR